MPFGSLLKKTPVFLGSLLNSGWVFERLTRFFDPISVNLSLIFSTRVKDLCLCIFMLYCKKHLSQEFNICIFEILKT